MISPKDLLAEEGSGFAVFEHGLGEANRAGSPVVELIAVAVMQSNVRCLRLPQRELVVFRPKERVYDLVEGEILKVVPAREWRYKTANYISGTVIDTYIDGSVLAPVPLELYLRDVWDPGDEFAVAWDASEKHKLPLTLRRWVDTIMKAGKRPVFEMEQVIPGCDPEDLEDPITIAAGYGRAGDLDTAFDMLQKCLEGDLRCIDAYAHLGLYYMGDARSDWSVRKAIRCYQAGVQVGERTLPPGFDGLLPWGWIDNRPFLRALHGLGFCQWRLGDFTATSETFRRVFVLDPDDSLGIRFLLKDVEDGRDYLESVADET